MLHYDSSHLSLISFVTCHLKSVLTFFKFDCSHSRWSKLKTTKQFKSERRHVFMTYASSTRNRALRFPYVFLCYLTSIPFKCSISLTLTFNHNEHIRHISSSTIQTKSLHHVTSFFKSFLVWVAFEVGFSNRIFSTVKSVIWICDGFFGTSLIPGL